MKRVLVPVITPAPISTNKMPGKALFDLPEKWREDRTV